MKHLFRCFLAICGLAFALISCRKDPVITDSSAKLSFSLDTVMFDTVFTSVGSVTKRFKIFNPNSKKIVVSSIKIGRGSASMFRMNVDGISGKEIHDVEIGAKDSLFVFVEVTVNPNNQNNPLVVSDSIVFLTNGNQQYVQLVAWGQDAYFHVAKGGGIKVFPIDSFLHSSVTWDNKKPHVVYGYALVDSTQQLTIQAGAKVYFHKGSGLIVYKQGSLKVQGTLSQPVTFQGDRLDANYSDLSSQWDRIWLSGGSIDNKIDYAIIKNGNVGVQVDTVGNANPTLVMNNTIIKNMGAAAFYAQGAVVQATNCVLSNSGQFLAYLNIGGDYSFTHCTFANYWREGNRKTSSVILSNYYKDLNGTIQLRNLRRADFKNCIVEGSLDNEITYDAQGGALFNYSFDHCILRIDPAVNTSDGTNYKTIYKNVPFSTDSAVFKSYYTGDFELSDHSVAIDKGDPATLSAVPLDIKGKSRAPYPDLGAYEKK